MTSPSGASGRVLVNLSGGIDSAYSLYLMLKEGRSCLVHHISLRNWEGRAGAEAHATEQVLGWLTAEGLTNWEYVQTGFNYGDLRYIVLDLHVWSFFTGVILANPKNADVGEVVVSSHLDSPFMSDPDRERRRREQVRLVAGREPEWLFPIGQMTKAEVVRACPPGLLKRTWWCRRPRSGRPCHKCHTCEQVDSARREEALT